ncbi:hypothetical protein [Sphingomonas sp. VNH70]|uniref:hypothetical protein n=1 Tax=Sphingomonas silueang TaxID=3156617 RepID=UPI0032B3D667
MRGIATIAAAMLLAMGLGGCGLTPGDGGPQLTVAGPSAAVEAFVRAQGAHRPTRATTFPQALGNGQASARVLMPAGTPVATMQRLADEAIAAGLTSGIVAGR